MSKSNVKNEISQSFLMGGDSKRMVGCWGVKMKTRDGGNRKRAKTAKEKAKGKGRK